MSGQASSESSFKIPRDKDDDYRESVADARRRFVTERTGAELDHVAKYSIDPSILPGNVENFFGVAQVPIGLAGPLLIVGEHAIGSFYIPLATTEGTLVASYSRGMRLLSECGGVKTTVVEQYMQRSPVFIWDDALKARDFGKWVDEHFTEIKVAAIPVSAFYREARESGIVRFCFAKKDETLALALERLARI